MNDQPKQPSAGSYPRCGEVGKSTQEIAQLVRERRRTHGGFCGSCEAIAQWLFRAHNVVTSTSWIAHVLSSDGR